MEVTTRAAFQNAEAVIARCEKCCITEDKQWDMMALHSERHLLAFCHVI